MEAQHVSIPNGMEFYVDYSVLRLYSACFNSQRDGILRFRSLFVCLHYDVSIPNGMEFYLRFAIHALEAWDVSIPNGMEFYPISSKISRKSPKVSIPNGMEFYADYSKNTATKYISFNSQRDGILLISRFFIDPT